MDEEEDDYDDEQVDDNDNVNDNGDHDVDIEPAANDKCKESKCGPGEDRNEGD